jgi:6-phosphogluconate dehydrogenase (decarboxylating)
MYYIDCGTSGGVWMRQEFGAHAVKPAAKNSN